MRRIRQAAGRYRRGPAALAVSGAYAVLVVGVFVFVVIAGRYAGTLAGVWLVLVTLPVSGLLQKVPAEGYPYGVLLVLGGLLQAWLLWLVLRGRRLS
jgi:hypothetical protein